MQRMKCRDSVLLIVNCAESFLFQTKEEKGWASAGERQASDRNGAPESVACLSRRRVCGASSGVYEVSSSAGAALTSLLLSGSSQKVGS